MAPTLYSFMPSPYCRSVLLTARAAGIELDVKPINLIKNEQMTPEFLAINPQHTVPTLVDGDLVLCESRAILTYLISRYAKDDSLYPKDIVTRAKVDAFLFFDCSTLCIRWRAVMHPIMRKEGTKPSPEAQEKLAEALKWLDDKLARNPDRYIAETAHMTVADLAFTAWVSTYEAVGFSLSSYPHIAALFARCRGAAKDYEELNGIGAELYGAKLKSLMNVGS